MTNENDTTTLTIKVKTRKMLHDRKKFRETWDDVIQRMALETPEVKDDTD